MGLSLRSKVFLSAGLALALALAGALGLRFTLDQGEHRNFWVMHTLEVIAAAESMARSAEDAQAATQIYLLVGDAAALRAFDDSASGFAVRHARLLDLVVDDGAQRERLHSVPERFAQWRVVAQRLRGASPAREVDSALLAEASARMAEVLAVIDHFVEVERTLLVERRQASLRAGRVSGIASIAVLMGAVALSMLLALLIALRVTRDAVALRDVARAVADGDLARRAVIRSSDELGELGSAFNEMAGRLERRHRNEMATSRLRDMLQASQSSSEAYEVVERMAAACLDDAPARLYVMDEARTVLVPAAGWGDEARRPPDDSFTASECWALRAGRAHLAVDQERDVECPHLGASSSPHLCSPLVAQGETIGLLCLVPVAGAVPASVAEVAEMLGLRLANLRLRDVLRTQAIRDPLTGLFNRRYLEETLSREAARAGRNQSPLALMVFDVDHFKRFNDSHGHAGGDVMLQQVGSVLARSFRDSDVVCRFGGEEFVVIAPDCAADCAVARAETVLREMREQTVVIDGKQVAGATISAGVAVMPDHGTDPDVVFRAADAALYQSKASGRDRVTLASVAGVGTRSGTGARIEH